MQDLFDLTRVLKQMGGDPLLTQGSSGNASIKVGDTLWVTGSGKWLRHTDCNESFARIRVEDVLRGLVSEQEATVWREHDSCLKPSIETGMHAVIPQKIVIHLHAINTIACSVRADGIDIASALLEGLSWQWIPYTPSGRPLARKIFATVHSLPQVFVLANHGLVVAADSTEEAALLVADVECRLRMEPRALALPALSSLRGRIDVPDWSISTNRVVHSLALDCSATQRILHGTLFPCHWAYVTRHIATAGEHECASDAIARFRMTWGHEPDALLVPGKGVLVRDDADPEVLEQLAGLAEVVRRIPEDAPVRYLSPAEVAGVEIELETMQGHKREFVVRRNGHAQQLRDPELSL